MSDDQHIRYEVADHVARLTIDRPDRRNAMSSRSNEQLGEAFVRAVADPEVWVIVLTGTGDKAFCAGADLKDLDRRAQAGDAIAPVMGGVRRNIMELVMETPKPTVAAINGLALGGGAELAMACDIRLAVEDAVIGMPEAKRGMGATFGSVILPRLIPRAIAFELLYTGDPISAEEARAIGLVNRVFPRHGFQAEVDAFVARMTANAPLTLQRYKHMALKGWELPVQTALRLDVGPNPYQSEDRVEGIRAFLEKRPPQWQAR